MKRIISLLILAFALLPMAAQNAADTSAAPTAATFFSRAPSDVAAWITTYSRLVMIDYFAHGSDVKTEGSLGQKSGLCSLDDRKLVWRDDDSVTSVIAVIPAQRADTLLVLIRTIASPVADSRVSYYDKNWKPLTSAAYPQPAFSDWLTDAGKKSRSDIESQLPFMLASADFDPATQTLTFVNTAEGFFPDGKKPDCLALLKKRLSYKWDGRKFILLKDE